MFRRRASKIPMSVALMILLAAAGKESFAFMGNGSPRSSSFSICSRTSEEATMVGPSIVTLCQQQATAMTSNCCRLVTTRLYGRDRQNNVEEGEEDEPRTETTRELQFHYQILGLSRRNCNAKRIKEPYRRLARIYHPGTCNTQEWACRTSHQKKTPSNPYHRVHCNLSSIFAHIRRKSAPGYDRTVPTN